MPHIGYADENCCITVGVFVRVPHDQGGMAFASTGFAEEGTGFNRPQGEFMVVIPSQMEVYGTAKNGETVLIERLFDATQLDMSHTYVGNTMGVLLPERWVHLDQNSDGLIDVAIYYRIVGVEDDLPEALVTRLFPVQPNPFSSSTTIGFSLVADEHVGLQIHDARGGLVHTLAAGTQPAGVHQAGWYGLDAQGRHVAPGVYFVRFTAGAFKTT